MRCAFQTCAHASFSQYRSCVQSEACKQSAGQRAEGVPTHWWLINQGTQRAAILSARTVDHTCNTKGKGRDQEGSKEQTQIKMYKYSTVSKVIKDGVAVMLKITAVPHYGFNQLNRVFNPLITWGICRSALNQRLLAPLVRSKLHHHLYQNYFIVIFY